MNDIYNKIKHIAFKNKVSDCEILSYDIYEKENFNLKLENYPENLNYLKNEKRQDIKKWFKETKSILICIYQYWNESKDYEKIILNIKNPYNELKEKYKKINLIEKEKFKISRYALFEDYHLKIKKNLNEILNDIKKEIPNTIGKIFVDSSPIIEKRLASLANLGFQGRNTLFISPKLGSFVFIGGIALNLNIENKKEQNLNNIRNCEKCHLCEDACPTKALNNFKLNPLKCISYWTTHTNNIKIPEEIKNASNYIYGCDICQEVCPYNKKTEIKNFLF